MAPAVAALSINPTVLWATNALGINVKVDFIDDVAPDDYRLNVYVIENDVTGSGPGYDQRDYGPTGPIHSPYTHLNVLRYTTTGTWGDTTFFPERPMVGESYEGYFRQDINPEYNFLNTTVVAFITRHHPTDPTKREILNAVAYRLDGAVSVDEDDVTTAELGIAPNPALDVVHISVPSNDQFVIYSVEGSEIITTASSGSS